MNSTKQNQSEQTRLVTLDRVKPGALYAFAHDPESLQHVRGARMDDDKEDIEVFARIDDILPDEPVRTTPSFDTWAASEIAKDPQAYAQAVSELRADKIRPNYYRVDCRVKETDDSTYFTTVECQDVIDALELNFNLGNTLKYLWRAGRKTPDALEDLKKARQCLDFEIQKKESAK